MIGSNDINTVYMVHQQNVGNLPSERNGMACGFIGKSLRLEGFRLTLEVPEGYDIHVMARAHVQDKGWLDPVYDGDLCGTEGKGLRLEAIQLQLSGKDAENLDIWQQVHVENIGWMNWMRGGELSGSEGFGLRIESIKVIVLEKSKSLKADNCVGFVKYVPPEPTTSWQPANMVSEHFSLLETACDCIPEKEGFGFCDGFPEKELMEQNRAYLIYVLEALRNYFQTPVIITSMIRCPQCNEYWGGIPGSYHTTWQAVDIVVPGHDSEEVATTAYNLTGCGARFYVSKGFTHIEPPGCGIYKQED